MKTKLFLIGVLTVLVGSAVFGHDDHGPKIADVHQVMEVAQKPAMDQLAAIMKAGGPQNDADWAHSTAYATILLRTTKLLMQEGVVKDDVWEKGATKVIDSAKAAIDAGESHDLNAWKTAAGGIGQGCRGCHNKHKPKKEKEGS
jgi:cytochrome c556